MPDLSENEKEQAGGPSEAPREGNWKDEMGKSYYYDDSHGYEDFDPEEGLDEE